MLRNILFVVLFASVPLVIAFGGGDIWPRIASANGGERAGKSAPVQERGDVKCDFPEWIGEPVDRQAVKQAAGDRPFRIYGVNDMVTMDYREERLNVIVDSEGIVKRVKCG